MKQSTAISIALHVAVLLWATLSYSGQALEAPKTQAMPVDFISEKDFSQMTKGIKEAPKKKKQQLKVEKIDTPKPIDQPKAKVAKKEVKAAHDKPPPPQPKVKPPEKQKKEAKAEPKPPPKIDPIAEKLKEESAKKHLAKIAPELPPRRPPRPRHKEPKFDANKIAELLNKRDPTRVAAAGDKLNNGVSFGQAMGNSASLSQSEIDALRARLMSLWNPPNGIKNPQDYVIRIRIRLGPDRRLSGPPILLSTGHDQIFQAAAASALRAVFQAQPFDMLKPDHYALWKDIEVTFDPRDMFRG